MIVIAIEFLEKNSFEINQAEYEKKDSLKIKKFKNSLFLKICTFFLHFSNLSKIMEISVF